MTSDDERIALFLDYENLAIGARDGLGVSPFDLGPVADALAERGRVVTRRAYADWSFFDEDRKLLVRHQVELIELPQRMGFARKNAADIKMAVDAIELAYERGFITTFAIGTGDSDFTPLVHKLREMDKRVIGIGVQSSTSALLPPACDEFLFYDRLPGVDAKPVPRRTRTKPVAPAPEPEPEPPVEPEKEESVDVAKLVASTLAGLQRHADGPVLGSRLKRAILRKDPTFDESDHGSRGFGELLRRLAEQGVLVLTQGSAAGDPAVDFPEHGPDADAFALLTEIVRELGRPQLSGLKDRLRKRSPDFSEKRYGFGSFLAFARAASARGLVDMEWSDELGDWVLSVP
ncbi:NYN domain-containing protein [Pseudonocardia pini]|uniref:NYN domain-containing protein n=1 Tax=Pseudonocardia pini TaxID=2758030 RepID=UPI0015F0B282|nr:PIN domain-containing protein [Pseudonocardia pini]